jgi:hypothetical protein
MRHMRLDMRSREQHADKKGRGEILDQLVSVTGMNRDYLATVLGRYGKDGTVVGKQDEREEEAQSGVEARRETAEIRSGIREGSDRDLVRSRAALRETAGTDDTWDDRISEGGGGVWHNE